MKQYFSLLFDEKRSLDRGFMLILLILTYALIYVFAISIFHLGWSKEHVSMQGAHVGPHGLFGKFHSMYEYVIRFGDNKNYVQIANSIKNWNFNLLPTHPTPMQYHFWGLPILVAIFSKIAHINCNYSLIAVSILSSIGAVFIVSKLFDGWVAIYFGLLNCFWLKLSVFGGSEPLFMLLLMGSFYLYRKNDSCIWLIGILLSCATCVRPIGVLALVAIAVDLMLKKDIRHLIKLFLISILIGLLYVGFVWYATGNPLYNLSIASDSVWAGGNVFGWPVYMISYALYNNLHQQPISNNVSVFFWVAFTVCGVIRASVLKAFSQYRSDHLAEMLFLWIYFLFMLSYNMLEWATCLPRFLILILPFCVFAFKKFLIRSKIFISLFAVGASLLAAVSFYGVGEVYKIL